MTIICVLDPVRSPRSELAYETFASKLQRTAAPAFDFEVKTYVGGKYELANLDALLTGQNYDPTNETTLTADVDPNDASIAVTSTTGFDKGTFIIEPASSTEQHEMIGYGSKDATSFLSCTRGELEAEKEGYHTAGDKVYEWFPITDYVRQINVSYDMRDGVAAWNATIRGWNYNSRLLDNDHAILTLIRWRPKDDSMSTWTTWGIWFVGYLTSADLDDDHTQAKEWSGKIAPISDYVNATDVPALHFGRENLAENKTVTVSSYLEDPYLALNTGEYVGYPNLDGPNAVDEDIATLWMSKGLPETAEIGHTASGFSINEVYLRPPPGYLQRDYQWIEIAYKGTGTGYLGQCNLGWRTTGGYGTTFATAYGNRVVSTNYLKFSVLSNFKMDDDGSFAIICSNAARFKELFGGAGATYIIEWHQVAVGDFWLDPDAGMLFLMNKRMGLGYPESVVWWRSGAKPFALHDWQGDADNPGQAYSGWNGYMIPSDVINLPPGTSFTRRPDGTDPFPDSADSIASFHYPNYDPTPGQRQKWGYEFISVDLGEMNIVLDSELSSGETDEAVMDASLGLNPDGGLVQINAEIIRYESLDTTDNKLENLTRAQLGTTAATHPVDSIVKQWEDGTAYNLYSIGGLTLLRRRNLDSNGNPIVAKHLDVFVTDYTNPVMPDDHLWDNGYYRGGWQAYWTKVYSTATNESPVLMVNFAKPRRCRHVCVIIYEMSNAGRACVNEFKIYPSVVHKYRGGPAPIPGQPEVIQDAYWSGMIIRNILSDHFGIYPGNFIMTDLGRPIDDLPTTKGAAGSTIKDICQRTGCMLLYRMDNRIEHRFDPSFPMKKLDDILITWDRTYARKVRLERPFRHTVSQVKLWASNPFLDEHFEARYPPEPLDLGSEMTVEDVIVSDLEDAHHMAQMHFARENGPLGLTIEPTGPAEWVQPGQRHGIDWLLDEDGVYLQGQNFVVMGCEWQVDFGDKETRPTWRSSIRLQELKF
jgi:hypothetical protein